MRDMLNWPYIAVAAALCGYLILTVAVFFALRTLVREIGTHCRDNERFKRAAFVVLPTVILIGVILYLVLYILYHAPLTLNDDSFYSQAVVSAGKSVPFAVHGASWLYPCLLHIMLLLFGNTPFAGVVLQILLFFMCLLFIYIGMQSCVGVVPAAVSMGMLAFLPVSREFLFSLTPEFFYLALYLFGFCSGGIFFKNFRDKSRISSIQYFFATLLGIYIGFLLYLDLSGILLYFLFAVLFFSDKGKRKQAAGINLTILSGVAVGSVLSVLPASRTGGMYPMQYLEAICELYAKNAGISLEILKKALPLPDITLTGSLLLISFAFFVIPSFFIRKRNRSVAFILNLFFLYCLCAFLAVPMNMQMMVTCFWCILAGVGFSGVVFEAEGNRQKKKKIQREKTMDMRDNTEVNAKIQEQEKPPPGEPLHNPLPVPKKKNRAQADFAFQVKEADMKFDIDVADDDDFDV